MGVKWRVPKIELRFGVKAAGTAASSSLVSDRSAATVASKDLVLDKATGTTANDGFISDRATGTRPLSDYNNYVMSLTERILYTASAAAVIFAAAYVFYRSLVISLLFTPLALLYLRYKKGELVKRRKKELSIQFKDMLYSLSSSLSAGKTVEGAFREVLRDLAVLYPDPGAFIMTEIEYIIRRLDMNDAIETILSDFAGRAHLDDVDNFVDVFNICKRTGGNMVEVIKNTSSIINDRIEVRQEIDTMLAERKFEQKVLTVVPIALLVLLSASAADYMGPIFTTAAGRCVTTVSVILLTAAYFISRRITDIRI